MVVSEVYIERSNHLSPAQIGGILNESSTDGEVLKFLEKGKEIDEFIDNQVIPLLEIEIRDNEEFRNKIIPIKRKIFNRKSINQSCLEFFINDGTKQVISTYLSMEESRRKLLASLETRYMNRTHDEYKTVKRLLKQSNIYNSLVMTNKNIKVSLDRFLKNEKMDKKDRKVFIRLFSFLTRAAKKCSPLGDITLSTVHGVSNSESTKNMYVRINYTLLTKWWDVICKMKVVRERKRYFLSPMVRFDKNKIYNTVLVDNGIGHLTKTKAQIKVYSLKLSKYLFDNQSMDYSTFLQKVEEDMDGESLNKIWNYLIDEGLLILDNSLEEQSEKYLELIIEECDQFLELKALKDMFLDISNSVKILEKDFNLNNLENLEIELKKLNQVLPIDNFSEVNHVYFDYVQAGNKIDRKLLNYQDILYKIQLILLAFDTEVKRKILIADVFKQLYPNGVEGKDQILTALKKIGEQPTINDPVIMDMYLTKYNFDHAFENSRVNELHFISRKFLELFSSELLDSKHLKLDLKTIDELAERIQKLVPDYSEYSQNIFAQIVGNSLVINHIYPGQGMFFNRFIKYLKDDMQKTYVSKQLTNTCDENVLDIEGVFGFNANLRFSITKKSLALPYYKPKEGSLSLDDLKMSYDEETMSIQFQNKKDRVRPLFLGTLVITAVPVPIGMLNTLGANSAPLGNYFEMLFNTETKLAHLPRISFQNSHSEVVTSREKWRISTTLFIDLKVRDFKSWFWLQLFFSENRLPRRFYVKSGDEKDYSSLNEKGNYKPQFINISSPASTDLFIKTIMNNHYLLIEEEFPVNNNQVAREYVLESSISKSISNGFVKRERFR